MGIRPRHHLLLAGIFVSLPTVITTAFFIVLSVRSAQANLSITAPGILASVFNLTSCLLVLGCTFQLSILQKPSSVTNTSSFPELQHSKYSAYIIYAGILSNCLATPLSASCLAWGFYKLGNSLSPMYTRVLGYDSARILGPAFAFWIVAVMAQTGLWTYLFAFELSNCGDNGLRYRPRPPIRRLWDAASKRKSKRSSIGSFRFPPTSGDLEANNHNGSDRKGGNVNGYGHGRNPFSVSSPTTEVIIDSTSTHHHNHSHALSNASEFSTANNTIDDSIYKVKYYTTKFSAKGTLSSLRRKRTTRSTKPISMPTSRCPTMDSEMEVEMTRRRVRDPAVGQTAFDTWDTSSVGEEQKEAVLESHREHSPSFPTVPRFWESNECDNDFVQDCNEVGGIDGGAAGGGAVTQVQTAMSAGVGGDYHEDMEKGTFNATTVSSSTSSSSQVTIPTEKKSPSRILQHLAFAPGFINTNNTFNPNHNTPPSAPPASHQHHHYHHQLSPKASFSSSFRSNSISRTHSRSQTPTSTTNPRYFAPSPTPRSIPPSTRPFPPTPEIPSPSFSVPPSPILPTPPVVPSPRESGIQPPPTLTTTNPSPRPSHSRSRSSSRDPTHHHHHTSSLSSYHLSSSNLSASNSSHTLNQLSPTSNLPVGYGVCAAPGMTASVVLEEDDLEGRGYFGSGFEIGGGGESEDEGTGVVAPASSVQGSLRGRGAGIVGGAF